MDPKRTCPALGCKSLIAIAGRSTFGNAGHAQALIAALAPGEVSWIVGRRAGAETPDREGWVQCKSRLRRCPRLILLTEKRQLGSEMEMRGRKISVRFKPPAHPRDGFSAGIELRLAEAGPQHPYIRKCVARRKAKCFVDVMFRFSAATEQILGVANETMSTRRITIQC